MSTAKKAPKGLAFSRHFTQDGKSAYDLFQYEMRTSVIRNPNGEKVFEMNDVEVPAHWSQIATDILAQKYFRKAGVPQPDGSLGRETSVKQVAHRLADCWRQWGEKYGYFASKQDAQVFYDELVFSILSQSCAPNSPQWFNTGLHSAYGITGDPQGHYFVDPISGKLERSQNAYERPQPHACARYNTRLFTNKGILQIGDIVTQNRTDLEVFDGNRFVKILAVKDNGVKPVFRATLANGNFIEFTGDHQIWSSALRIKDGGVYNWKPLAEILGLKVQQTALTHALPELELVAEAAEAANGPVKNFVVQAWENAREEGEAMVSGKKTLDLAKAALAGWVVSDGYYGKYNQNNKTTMFGVITINDDEYAHVTGLFNDIFGASKTVVRRSVHDLYRIVKHDRKEVDDYVAEYELAQSSLTARVPERIMQGTMAEKCAFLQSLFQGDGSVRVRKEEGRNSGDVVLTSISEELVHGVQMLLLNLGIYSNISPVADSREDRHMHYQLTIAYSSERRKFEQLIGFISADKKAKLSRLNSEISGKSRKAVSEQTVVSIDFIGEETVYDIQTETAQFAANGVTVHNCFILSVDDDLVNPGGLMDLWVREARIFKYGSGVGTNYSNIRAEGEKLAGGGTSSGLMSFLRIGDRAAGAIKSGGTTRRAAKMVCLDLDHPEIEQFIDWKVEEEKKVAALIAAGYASDYEGEAYRTVSGQNSNNSVRIPNAFFRKLESGGDWEMTARTDGHVMKKTPARALWDKIAYAAWRCADPGTQYDTTINEWHTCPEGGPIRASNPCSEYMFLDNTACNLASLNLRKFFNEETSVFDVEGFEYATRLWTVVLEISVLMAQFPSPEVAQLSYDYRTLGLGFANLGSMLMVSGIPYDSEEGRAIAGGITAIMNGISYKTSAEMAQVLGTFPRYEENREHMLRVMRNHRAAAYDATDAYDNLEIKPMGISAKYCPEYLLRAATKAWDDCVQMGEKYGYRNAQATVIAPTGTIGLVMDCDTTGVEPDFALVKFKKLSGGGYMKIVNQSVPAALKKLGYSESELDAMVKYAKGHGTFAGAPYINHQTLSEKGLMAEELKKLDAAVESAFDIAFVFNVYTLGEECLKRLGFTPEEYYHPEFSLLEALGFEDDEIEAANDYVCGTMMMEGAPGLKPEHQSVFDTANKCGKKGERYIHAHGHIRMMAAVQPFISGAISKTINLPNEATEAEIKDCYQLSWELGIKACALYRDGSKLSQPLSNKSDKKKKDSKDQESKSKEAEGANAKHPTSSNSEASNLSVADLSTEELLDEVNRRVQAAPDTKLRSKLATIVERKQLPARRRGYTIKGKVGGQALFLRTGEYGDGTLGEIFIDMAKEGATMRSLLNSFAIAVSVGLQYGVPLDEYVDKFIFTRFEPAGMVDHPNIKSATSVLDYIFRVLAYEYLDRDDLVHVPDASRKLAVATPEISGNLRDLEDAGEAMPKAGRPDAVHPGKPTEPVLETVATHGGHHNVGSLAEAKADQKKLLGTSADAPACRQCGNITLRNGTCYMCPNCGTTTGCS